MDPCRNRWCKWYNRAESLTHCESLACARGVPPEGYCVDFRAREMAALLYEVSLCAAVADDPRMHYYEIQVDRPTLDRIRALFAEGGGA